MLFNSYAFLFVFLPATLLIFYGLRRSGRRELSVPFLMLASLAFYAYWRPPDTLILVATIFWNFLLSRSLSRLSGTWARLVLTVAIAGNLGLLCYFKYFDFIAINLASLIGAHYQVRGIVMPIGISFFTFTQIAYLVDCFRSRDYEARFSNYGLFVTVFPHLISGPIIHHAQMRPQFVRLRRDPVDPALLALGMMMFIVGLAKKVLLADNVVDLADPVFAAADKGALLSVAHAWIGIAAYTLQIYFDFSGYSDMAVGLGLLFGLRLPVNFASPYKSRSIIEFWRRWHISLSTWLRDYLYIPLGGNRGGEFMRLRNIAITMVLGGIWHGAGWTFVIWGALHATYIVINHLLHKFRPPRQSADPPLLSGIKWLSTLLFAMIAWAFFRARTVAGAVAVLRSMAFLGPRVDTLPSPLPTGLFCLVLAGLLVLFAPNTQQIFGYTAKLDVPLGIPKLSLWLGPRRRLQVAASSPTMTFVLGVLFAAVLASIWRPAIFIYFNF